MLERFPKLKIVLVENELGWIPFVLEQWDYYFKRHGAKREGLAIRKPPSEYFHKQIYTTFFDDAVGGHILSWRRQLPVVQRLPARQQDLAELAPSDRPRPGQSPRARARQTRTGKRRATLQHTDSKSRLKPTGPSQRKCGEMVKVLVRRATSDGHDCCGTTPLA